MDNIIRTAVDDSAETNIIKKQVEERKDDMLIRHPVIGIGGGEAPTITVEPLSVTENGTYTAGENAAYNPVVVNVPAALPNEYLESEFDLLHSNSTVGFTDSVKNIKLATNKYNQFADGFITGRSAGVMMGYTNQGDIKRCLVKMGTFDRTVETSDQYQTLFKLVSGNNHFTIRYDNTNSWWLISDATGANIKVLDADLPKYSFDGANVEIVFGAKYIDGELYKGIKQGDIVTTDYSNHFFVYINGELKIEAMSEQMVGDTLNTIGVFNVGGRSSTWVGACFENVKIYNVLNCYNKYYVNVNNEVIPTAKTIIESEVE